MIDQLIVSLVVAAVTGMVTGAVTGARMFGRLEAQGKVNAKAIDALHARLDAWMIAMAEHGLVSPGALAHLARGEERKVANERRR